MLTDLATTKALLRISSSDTSQDTLLTLLIAEASQVVTGFMRQKVVENAVVTEYRDGNNAVDLALWQRPVRSFCLAGNLTSGSAVVTGLSGTTGLVAGMPAVAQVQNNPTAALPNNTTILSVDGSSQVTLSAQATLTQAALPIVFGLSVWYDPAGYAGRGPGSASGGPFAAGTLLLNGYDFDLLIDQPDGTSKSAVLRRIGLGGYGAPWGFWGGYGYADQGGRRGGLTARLPPTWGNTYQGIKIVYYAGWGVGAVSGGSLPTDGTQLPAEISYACSMVVGWMRALAPAGVPLDSSSVERQASAILSGAAPGGFPEAPAVRAILARYRGGNLPL